MNSWLYIGKVMHQRHQPFDYRFDYSVMSLCVDIDSFSQDIAKIRGLSHNRFNWWSFYDQDYGPRTQGANLREWFDQLLRNYGVENAAHNVKLVCFPRFLGYTFNPLAMWYAFDSEKNLIAVVCEVSNTFGHWHHYVLTDNGKPLITHLDKSLTEKSTQPPLADEPEMLKSKRIKARASKRFHVSPFMEMQDDYEFRFAVPDDIYQIGIYQKSQAKPLLTSTQSAKKVDLSSNQLLKATFRLPLQSFKIIFLIHWWAIKIWFKGGKFRSTPKHQRQNQYSHSEIELC